MAGDFAEAPTPAPKRAWRVADRQPLTVGRNAQHAARSALRTFVRRPPNARCDARATTVGRALLCVRRALGDARFERRSKRAARERSFAVMTRGACVVRARPQRGARSAMSRDACAVSALQRRAPRALQESSRYGMSKKFM
jgi:hypothetical protein